MNNLTGEVKLSGKAFGDVTIQTTNADGSMRGLTDILGDCRGAFAQMTESEKAQAAEALVGKNAMSGFLALMNAAPEDIEKLSSSIDTCNTFVKTKDGAIIPMSEALEKGIEQEYNGVSDGGNHAGQPERSAHHPEISVGGAGHFLWRIAHARHPRRGFQGSGLRG
jgi:TP901 family phage tail tape measure protein